MTRNYLTLLTLCALFFAVGCSKDEDIDPTAPIACFSLSGDVYAEAGAAFNSDCSKNAAAYYWDFGDGDYSTEANPTHTYDTEGSFKVTLTVTSDLQQTHSTSQNIAVKASPFIKHSGYIDVAEVWEEGMHLVTSNVTIRHGSLKIEPGAVIYMDKEESIYVGHTDTTTPGGALFTAEGTESKPIVFLPASGVQTGGEWGHIFFTAKASTASSLKYCELKYGGKADASWDYDGWTYYSDYGVVDINGTSVSIENTTITGAANFGLSLWENSYFSSFINNTVTDNASYPIWIHFSNAHTIGTGNHFNGKGILLHGQYFKNEGEVTWNKLDVPYILDGAKDILTGILRIQPGTTVAFAKEASLDCDSKVIAEGTAAEPILFTSAEETKAKGDWMGIEAGLSTFKYCRFEYGGGPTFNNHRRTLVGGDVIENCTIIHSAGNGIELGDDDLSTTFLNNTIEDCDKYAITLYAVNLHTLDLNNTIGADTKGVYVSAAYAMSGDVTWIKRPYKVLIGGNVSIGRYDALARLTIAPGARLDMTPGSGFQVAYETGMLGELVAVGTATERIVITLDEESNNGSTFWSGIKFGIATTAESKLINCDLSYGGQAGNEFYGMVHFNRTTNAPVVADCTISNAGNFGFSYNAASPQISGITFKDNAQDEYTW